MYDDPLLKRICEALVLAQRAHTILLYGSRADGSAGPDSDYDIAAFGPIDMPLRDARVLDGAFLDIFVYPEAVLHQPAEDYLRLRGSTIILQRESEAENFLNALEKIFRSGPEPLAADELEARKVWVQKMLVRMQRGDAQGHYRRVWLLAALLEDYFHYRRLWYQGPKKSLHWLKEFDAPAHHAFTLALAPNANKEAIYSLAQQVVGGSFYAP